MQLYKYAIRASQAKNNLRGKCVQYVYMYNDVNVDQASLYM